MIVPYIRHLCMPSYRCRSVVQVGSVPWVRGSKQDLEASWHSIWLFSYINTMQWYEQQSLPMAQLLASPRDVTICF